MFKDVWRKDPKPPDEFGYTSSPKVLSRAEASPQLSEDVPWRADSSVSLAPLHLAALLSCMQHGQRERLDGGRYDGRCCG